MSNNLRKELFDMCLTQIDDKIKILNSEFNLYKESAANETKSTAGDKHDTSKSMMQMEQEKMGSQLNDLLNQKKVLMNITLNDVPNSIGLGSIIFTNHGNFFLSIFSKPISVDQKIFHPISLQSPIGRELLKSKPGLIFSINGKEYEVLNVV